MSGVPLLGQRHHRLQVHHRLPARQGDVPPLGRVRRGLADHDGAERVRESARPTAEVEALERRRDDRRLRRRWRACTRGSRRTSRCSRARRRARACRSCATRSSSPARARGVDGRERVLSRPVALRVAGRRARRRRRRTRGSRPGKWVDLDDHAVYEAAARRRSPAPLGKLPLLSSRTAGSCRCSMPSIETLAPATEPRW